MNGKKPLNGKWFDIFGIEDSAKEYCINECKAEAKKYITPTIIFGSVILLLTYRAGKENG